MRQLMDVSGAHLIIAFGDRVFVLVTSICPNQSDPEAIRNSKQQEPGEEYHHHRVVRFIELIHKSDRNNSSSIPGTNEENHENENQNEEEGTTNMIAPNHDTDDSENDELDENPTTKNNSNLMNIVQAVSCTVIADDLISMPDRAPILLCAVSRADKTISMYEIHIHDTDHVQHTQMRYTLSIESNPSEVVKCELITPTVVHSVSKRIIAMTFTQLFSKSSSSSSHILLGGDVIGDITAFPTHSRIRSGVRRLILGHTASMITSVRVITNPLTGTMTLLSSDRDEKVRVSSFPQGFIVQGYFLGHSEFISDMDTVVFESEPLQNYSITTTNACAILHTWSVSCGGDKTIRLWNVDTCTELARLDIIESLQRYQRRNGLSSEEEVLSFRKDCIMMIPTRLSFNHKATFIAVIYDDNNYLHIIQVLHGVGGNTSEKYPCLKTAQVINCQNHPIGVKFSMDGTLLVMMHEFPHLVRYSFTPSGTVSDSSNCELCRILNTHVERLNNLFMPATILELDKMIRKPQNERETLPWLRTERVETARQRNIRRRKRLRDKESN